MNASREKYIREIVLVVQHVIMRWPRCAQQTTVRLQIEIKFGGMGNLGVHHSSCPAVTASICICRGLWEESDVVTLSDDDDGNLGGHSDLFASSCEVIVSYCCGERQMVCGWAYLV